MTDFTQLETTLDRLDLRGNAVVLAGEMLSIGEMALRNWIEGRGEEPTTQPHEGFLLLAMHRQGARGEPSFNACRETCRELVYHRNLIIGDPGHPDTGRRLELMRLVARHLVLFICGKMQVADLGEFCCSSRPLRVETV